MGKETGGSENPDKKRPRQEGQMPGASRIERFRSRFGRERSTAARSEDASQVPQKIFSKEGVEEDFPETPAQKRDREVSEMKQLVRTSADKIIATLPGEVDFAKYYAVGALAQAFVDTEGMESAHQYAEDAIETLGMSQEEAFHVWIALCESGDTEAFSKARQAAGVALLKSKDDLSSPDVRQILSASHNAKRLVRLVEAGDIESIDVAREVTTRSSIHDRPDLLSRLYLAHDLESLDIAISTAREAKAYDEHIGDTSYERAKHALSRMAHHAIQEGDTEDALKLIDAIEDKNYKAMAHSELYAKGRVESLQPALEYIEETGDMGIVRMLAEGGYPPAITTLKSRIKEKLSSKTNKKHGLMDEPLRNLVTLHRIGDASAAQTVSDIVHNCNDPVSYLSYLDRVGLKNESAELAKQIYRENPEPYVGSRLLDFTHDNSVWQAVFDHNLSERNEPIQAAQYVALLASRAKKLEEGSND